MISEILRAKGADALFLHWKDPNHFWLLGRELEDSYIIIPRRGKPLLLKGPLEHFSDRRFKVMTVRRDELKKYTKKIKKLCVNKSYFTLRMKDNFRAKIIDAEEDLLKLRSVKRKEELTKLRIANKHTAKCFGLMMREWKRKKWKNESDAVMFIKRYALEHDLGLAFDPIIASGKNAATPHHDSKGKITRGFCVIDFGFKSEGYHADMTRTVFVGKPTEKEKEAYDLVFETQLSCIDMSIPGTKCIDLYEASIKLLGKEAKYFTHGLGHGTGVQIHEYPSMRKNTDHVLEENNVITIEPGIYDKKRRLGIRIEDSLIVKKKEPEILTNSATKRLILVPL